MKTKTNFGAVPTGLRFTFPASKRVWFVSTDRKAFSFEVDGNTKRWITPHYHEPVIFLDAR